MVKEQTTTKSTRTNQEPQRVQRRWTPKPKEPTTAKNLKKLQKKVRKYKRKQQSPANRRKNAKKWWKSHIRETPEFVTSSEKDGYGEWRGALYHMFFFLSLDPKMVPGPNYYFGFKFSWNFFYRNCFVGWREEKKKWGLLDWRNTITVKLNLLILVIDLILRLLIIPIIFFI